MKRKKKKIKDEPIKSKRTVFDGLTMAIDMSLRSTGIVILDYEDRLVDFKVIKTSADEFPLDEALIDHVTNEIENMINGYLEWDLKRVVIEGLSFAGFSSRKDVIAGLYWSIKGMVWKRYNNLLMGSIPVKTWRKNVMSNREFEKFKICKQYLKDGVFSKLPDDVQKKFLLYIENKGLPFDSVYDLSDAYFMGLYRHLI